MEWSPKDAMKAYLDTLHLSKVECNEDDKGRAIEPKCLEFISAMAAGKRAKRVVEITTEGITPLTIALGVAAKQTEGQLTCILAAQSDDDFSNSMKRKAYRLVEMAGLQHIIKLVHAVSPCQMMKQMQLMNIDFAVIDCKFDDNYLELMFKKLDANIIQTGSTVIVHSVHHRKAGSVSFAEVVRKRGVESVTLPIGQGIELTRIVGPTIRRHNRFRVTFHN